MRSGKPPLSTQHSVLHLAISISFFVPVALILLLKQWSKIVLGGQTRSERFCSSAVSGSYPQIRIRIRSCLLLSAPWCSQFAQYKGQRIPKSHFHPPTPFALPFISLLLNLGLTQSLCKMNAQLLEHPFFPLVCYRCTHAHLSKHCKKAIMK